MKKSVFSLVVAVAIILSCFNMVAFASENITLTIGQNTAYVDGQEVKLDATNREVVPFRENDSVYVPVRFIAEVFGGKVGWENECAVITLDDGTTVSYSTKEEYEYPKLENGKPDYEAEPFIVYIMTLNSKKEYISGPVINRYDRTFVPIDALPYGMGKTCTVAGDKITLTVKEISPKVFSHENIDESKPVIDLDDVISRKQSDAKQIYKTTEAGVALPFTVYYPDGFKKTDKRQAVVCIHGGGYKGRTSNNDNWDGDYIGVIARHFADEGYVAFSLSYRGLVKNAPNEGGQIMNQYEDIVDGLNYIADHASQYGIDLDKITLIADSAGSHLTGCVAMLDIKENKIDYDKVILCNPITDMTDPTWYEFVCESSTYKGFEGKSRDEIAAMMSPVFNIKKSDTEFITIHGRIDPTVNLRHSIEFNDKMTEAGNNSELHILEGTRHAFILAEYYKDKDKVKLAVQVIDDILKR